MGEMGKMGEMGEGVKEFEKFSPAICSTKLCAAILKFSLVLFLRVGSEKTSQCVYT